MHLLIRPHIAGTLLALTICAAASAATTPVVSYLQLLGPFAGNLDAPRISPDGRYLIFKQSNTTVTATDIYMYDRVSGVAFQSNLTINGAMPVNAKCDTPTLSNEGLYAVFACNGAQMGVTGNGAGSYFLYDLVNNRTEIVAHGASDAVITLTNPAAISPNGQYVAYRTSFAENLQRRLLNLHASLRKDQAADSGWSFFCDDYC